jgi:hypothetical protein
MKESTI